MDPELNERFVFPAAGEKTGMLEALQPAVLAFGGEATWTPEGSASVKATPVRVMIAFGFVIVKVKVETPPARMGLGAKALLIAGGAMTVRVALAVLPVPPLVEVTASLVFG